MKTEYEGKGLNQGYEEDKTETIVNEENSVV